MKIKGTIKHIELETGFWGIEGEDGKKYIPVNMPEQLKLIGQDVEVEIHPVKNMSGLHMWGEYVKITSFGT